MRHSDIEKAIILIDLVSSKKYVTSKLLQQEYKEKGIKVSLRTCQRYLCLAESHFAFAEWRRDFVSINQGAGA